MDFCIIINAKNHQMKKSMILTLLQFALISVGLSATTTKHFKTSNGINSLEIKYDGKIHVSDDDRSIRSISPYGFLNIGYRTFGNKRELLINSDRSGQLSYEFHEGRKEIPFEPEGRKWLSDVLLDVVRSTGIDADGRTTRFYSGQGIDAFVGEVSQIQSNSDPEQVF